MSQSRAINALAPFVALAPAANSPRAAADLVTQATSAAGTYVFAELLQQRNVQALAGHERYGPHFTLLQIFAWGTWESYQATPGLPALSPAQAAKLRLLSLLTVAAEPSARLGYRALCARLDLADAAQLEHLVTDAVYAGLVVASLDPAAQTVVITSVAPLRDLAPGSVPAMMHELAAWSARCDGVLARLTHDMRRVRADADRRARREAQAHRQIHALYDAGEKSGAAALAQALAGRSGHHPRAAPKRDPAAAAADADADDDDDDAMDVDGGPRAQPAGLFATITPRRGSK